MKKLDSEQRARRQPGCYSLIYSLDQNKFDIPSYFRDYHQSFMNSLVKQYNIDEAILDYNLYRFSECFQMFANDFIRRHRYPPDYFTLDNKQKQYAFEFYLQIDGIYICKTAIDYCLFFFFACLIVVDLFFMKTCSFRQAQRRSLNEGLFCIDEPRAQYSFSSCDNCSLCIPGYHLNCREELGPMIRFGPAHGFTFCHGYRTLLNCPANCQTRSLIYVMICPCRKFEYIGETNQRLSDRLRRKFIVVTLSIYQFHRLSHCRSSTTS